MRENDRKLRRGVPIDAIGARLVLLGALVWWQENGGCATKWAAGDWDRAFARLDPREAAAVTLHVVRGWGLERIGEWLGVSRGMAHELWRRGKEKLNATN